MTDLLVIPMRCCRIWPIVLGQPVGRCGICQQRPEPMEQAEIVAWQKERGLLPAS